LHRVERAVKDCLPPATFDVKESGPYLARNSLPRALQEMVGVMRRVAKEKSE